jgi:hypothetical protein
VTYTDVLPNLITHDYFRQIERENLHPVRAVLDEVSGRQNSAALMAFPNALAALSTKQVTGPAGTPLSMAADDVQIPGNLPPRDAARSLPLPVVF